MMRHLKSVIFSRGAALAVTCGVVGFAWFAAPRVVRPSRRVETVFSANAREKPFAVTPTCERVLPLSSDEYNWLKSQAQPPNDAPLTPSLCVHLIALHGLGVAVPSKVTGGRALLLDILLDSRLGEEFFGAPVLQRTQYGARFASHSDDAWRAEAHRGQCLAALAGQGLPLSHPVLLETERLTLRDLLNDSLAHFHLDQAELTWTAEAYALYLPPLRGWSNRFGERFSFDDLARELLARPLNEASCFGMHLISSLTIIRRVDQATAILSVGVRAAVTERLRELVRACAASQTAEGDWPLDWHAAPPRGMRPRGFTLAETAGNRLLMAAHVAQWLLILPPMIRAPQNVQRRAARWLHARLRAADGRAQLEEFCGYSHAAHALRHWAYCRSTNTGNAPDVSCAILPPAERLSELTKRTN